VQVFYENHVQHKMVKTRIIGIAGPSASGKSLLAKTIVSEVQSSGVSIITEDSYYNDLSHLPLEDRALVNFDHPNAFDHALLYQHLLQLEKGHAIHVPQYNYQTHTREQHLTIIQSPTLIIIEGILLLSDEALRSKMDVRIFMDTPLDICLLRRLQRDVQERGRSITGVLEQYEHTVRPMYFQFIEPSKRFADIIVPKGGENRIAIDLIKSNILSLLT
jgi:uridine kinase